MDFVDNNCCFRHYYFHSTKLVDNLVTIVVHNNVTKLELIVFVKLIINLVVDETAFGVGVNRLGPICDHHFSEYTGAIRVKA